MTETALKTSLEKLLVPLLGLAVLLQLGFSVKCFGDASAEKPVIQVLEKISVSAPGLKLGDLIRTKGLDATTLNELNALSLGDAPKYGEVRKFSDRGLSALLRYHLGLKQKELGNDLLEQVQLHIPHEVIVEGAGLAVKEDEIKQKILEKITELCGGCQPELVQLTVGQFKKYPPTAIWSVSIDNHAIRGPFSAKIEITDKLKIIDRIFVSGTVRLSQEVPVAQVQLNIGDRIRDGDIRFAKREITTSGDLAPTAQELQNAKLKRGVRPNQIIWRGDLERERVVNRGDQVEIVITQDTWKVTLKGVAQDAGMVGDRIRVVSLQDNKKVLSGVVVAKGIVELR